MVRYLRWSELQTDHLKPVENLCSHGVVSIFPVTGGKPGMQYINSRKSEVKVRFCAAAATPTPSAVPPAPRHPVRFVFRELEMCTINVWYLCNVSFIFKNKRCGSKKPPRAQQLILLHIRKTLCKPKMFPFYPSENSWLSLIPSGYLCPYKH